MTSADRALEYIQDGMVLGLGTGKAATEFIHALGQRVKAGLRVRGVPTSQASATLATQLGIPLTTLEEVEHLDVDVDGADEVDPQLNLVKGLGGALIREKIVAAASRKLLILVGSEKLAPALGTRGVLPVEVVPFAVPLVRRKLIELGYPPVLRQGNNGQTFITDNGNPILDCRIPKVSDPVRLEAAIASIPGVVGTGFFLGMADVVIVQDGDKVELKQR